MARGFAHAPGASPEVADATRPGVPLARIAELAQSRNAVVREAVAARSDVPLGAMVGLAHDHSVPVRAMVAANPSIAQSVAEHLSHDRHREVLMALASNPAVPVHVAEALTFHRRPEVRRAAAHRLDVQAAASEPAPQAHTLDSGIPELRERAQLATPPDGWEPAHGGSAPEQAPTDVRAQEVPDPAGHGSDFSLPTRTAPVRGFSAPLGTP